jgi:lactoylglutathione lyase
MSEDQPADFNPAYWPWGQDADKPRFLHTMLRVKDADASIRFYTEGLGMNVLDRFDFDHGRFSLVYLAFDGYDAGGALELTYNWDQAEPYELGKGYGHVSIGVPDIHAAVARLEAVGAEIPTRPKTMVAGAPHLAFAKDPDGYLVELIQTNRTMA